MSKATTIANYHTHTPYPFKNGYYPQNIFGSWRRRREQRMQDMVDRLGLHRLETVQLHKPYHWRKKEREKGLTNTLFVV